MTFWATGFARKTIARAKKGRKKGPHESVWECLERAGHRVAIAPRDDGYLLDGKIADFAALKKLANVYCMAEGNEGFA